MRAQSRMLVSRIKAHLLVPSDVVLPPLQDLTHSSSRPIKHFLLFSSLPPSHAVTKRIIHCQNRPVLNDNNKP